MLAGYCWTYLCTPHDLEWHLGTAFALLILQLWPKRVRAFLPWLDPAERSLLAASSCPALAAAG